MTVIRLLPRTFLTLAVLALALPARAETAAATFNVTASLTSKCEITTAPADVAFAYISFQTDPASSTGGGFQVRCTNTLPYALSLTVTTGTVAGLAYAISVPSGSFTGTGSNISHSVSGTMVAGQAGTCATSATPCTGSNQHTLTVTY